MIETPSLIRTRDARFEALAEFPYTPRYVDVPLGDGRDVRVAAIDEGPRDAPVVLMLHGGLAWSFGYRVLIRAVVRAGLRVVAPDLIGFGRSDKPIDRAWHTMSNHLRWLDATLAGLDLAGRDVTLIGHSTGAQLGLALCAAELERFARVVVLNCALPTGESPPSQLQLDWRHHAEAAVELPVGRIIALGCWSTPHASTVAGYDAPFPGEKSKAGPRALALWSPLSPDDETAVINRRTLAGLTRYERPFLTAFGRGDAVHGGADLELRARVPGARRERHQLFDGCGHHVMEDASAELTDFVIRWLGHRVLKATG